PAAPGDVVADHGAQPLQPVGAQHEPQFQRAEATAERHGPLGIVDHAVAAVRLQEFWADSEGLYQALGIPDELDGAIELRPQPFVWIEHDRVGLLGSAPQMPELGADHGGPGPGRIDVDVEAVPPRDGNDRGDVVGAADAGAADRGDDSGRQHAG